MTRSSIHRIALCIVTLLSIFTTLSAQSSIWQQTSGPSGGVFRSLAIDADGRLFAAGAYSGLLRSTDGGTSWARVSMQGIEAIAINSSGHVFCGSWGVQRSTDNGITWTQVNTGFPGNMSIQSLAIHTNGYLFAGMREGVFRSTDNGGHWTQVGAGLLNGTFYSVAVNSSGTIFAGSDSGRVFRSQDDGDSWVKVRTGTVYDYVNSTAFNSSGHLFIGSGNYGVSRSTDNGDTWTQINTGLTLTNVTSLAFNSSGVLFASTASGAVGGIFRSTDNGEHWTTTSTGLASPLTFDLLVNSSGTIYAGTSGGIFRSTDNADNWTEVPLKATVVYATVTTPNGHLFAGVYGDGVARSTDGGGSWYHANTGLNQLYTEAMGTNADGHVFAGSQSGIFRSTDEGATWTQATLNLSSGQWPWVFAFAAKSNGYLFAGGQVFLNGNYTSAIFRSTDNGANWTQVGTGLTGEAIRTLAINWNGDLFAGATEGTPSFRGIIFRSTDNGVTWTQLSTFFPAQVRSLVINWPNSIFAGTAGSGVYLSTNSGSSWNQVNTGLLNTDIRALAIDSSWCVYSGSGGGVFRSIDNGATWIQTNNGLTNLNVLSLLIHTSGFVYAGTSCGGVFKATIPPRPVNVTFTANTSTVPDTLKPNSFIQIRGNILYLGPWNETSQGIMTNIGGDYWRKTILLTPGDTLQYKYFTHVANPLPTGQQNNGWETDLQVVNPTTNNRVLIVGAADTTLPLEFVNGRTPQPQYWKPYVDQPDSIDVYFRVNMQVKGFTQAGQLVGVRGGGNTLGYYGKTFILRKESPRPNVSNPYDGSNFWSGSIRFPVSEFVDNISYKFVIVDADDPNANVVATDSWRSIPTKASPKDTTLYWKWWNDTPLNLTIPAIPTLTSPSTGYIDQPVQMSLFWNTVVGAGSYQVQVATDAGFAALMMDMTTTGTSVNTPTLASLTTYYWRVKAINSVGGSNWSEVRNFKTRLIINPSVSLQWNFAKTFYSTPLNTMGVHGIAVDPSGKVWIAPYGATDSIFVGGVYKKIRALYILNPDGSSVGFSPIRTITVSSITDTLYNSGRGLTTDQNGNILYSSGDALYRFNYQTGEGMNKVIPQAGVTLTSVARDAAGNIFIGHVNISNPLRIYDTNFNFAGTVFGASTGFSRTIAVSANGNDVYWPEYSNMKLYQYHSDNGAAGPYTKLDSISGFVTESMAWQKSTGLLWFSTGYDIFPPNLPYPIQTWYGYNVTTKQIIDSIGWDQFAGSSSARPRGIAFSQTGDTAYVACFNVDNGAVQMFVRSTIPQPTLAGEYKPDANTILLMHMNEPGGSFVNDASGHGNYGTANGTTIGDGRFDKARSFNGTSDVIDLGKPLLSASAPTYTFEAWIKADRFTATAGDIFFNGLSLESFVSINPGGKLMMGVRMSNGDLRYDSSQTAISLGVWTHCAGIYDYANGRIIGYINGVQVFNKNVAGLTPSSSSSSNTIIGGGGSNYIYSGLIDEVRLSNRVRSPQEFDLHLPPQNLALEISGTTVNLTWQDGGGLVGLLKYRIYRGRHPGSFALFDSTTSPAYADLNVPVGSVYYYRVSSLDSTGFEAMSSNFVATGNRSLTLTAPNGWDNWKFGTQQNITWSSSAVDNVRLEYSLDNGLTWSEITASTPGGTGSFAWTIPNVLSTRCRIRISEVVDGTLNDVSDNMFRINRSTALFMPSDDNLGITTSFGQFGCAWGDYDNDGDLDLFIPGQAKPNVLYRNDGGSHFTDVAVSMGIAGPYNRAAFGAVWADFDNDGDLDLLITDGGLRLFRNDITSFTDISAQSGVSTIDAGVALWQVTAGDYDKDGDLDVAFAGANALALPVRILRNNGSAVFTEVAGSTIAPSIPNLESWNPAWVDVDNDGDLDLWMPTIRTPNYGCALLLNQGGQLVLSDSNATGLKARSAITSSWGDFDNDGDMDLFLIPWTGDNDGVAKLFRNNGNGTFTDIAGSVGLASAFSSSRGTYWGDYDNDGDLDLVIGAQSNGIQQLYRNDNGTFVEVGSETGAGFIGAYRSAVFVDYDTDGVLDLYFNEGVSYSGSPSKLPLHNSGNSNHWIGIKPKGIFNNTAGIGARITIVTGAMRQVRDIQAGAGGITNGDLWAHFGLGSAATVDTVIIRWPKGNVNIYTNLAIDQYHTLTEPGNVLRLPPYNISAKYLNQQIADDTLASGKLPSRVYELQRGGLYLANAVFINSGNWTLRLRANDSSTTKKPVIMLFPAYAGSTPWNPPGNLFQLNGNLELKNLEITGYYELVDTNRWNMQGALINIPSTMSGLNITIDSCILSNTNGNHIRTDGAASVIKVTNTIFANMGYLGRSNLGAGKAIDLRNSPCDSLILVNNTFTNWQDRIVRHYPASGASSTGVLGYFLFDHNTLVNGMSFHGLLSLGTLGSNAIIINNLFLDAFALGNDTDPTRQAEYIPSGELDQSGNPRMSWIFSYPTSTTLWTIANNYYGISDSGQAFFNQFASAGVTGEGAPLTWHINSKLGADSVNAFKKIPVTLNKVPALMTQEMRWYRDPTGGNKSKNTPGAWVYGSASDPNDYDRKGYTWLRDSLNCSYSTVSTAYAGGTGGFPAGDLNWFPTRKQSWPGLIMPEGPMTLAGEYKPDANTVFLLHMNEASGPTVMDASGYGNNGTFGFGSLVPAKMGNGYLPATSNGIYVQSFIPAGLGEHFTIEAWVKLSAAPAGVWTFLCAAGARLHVNPDLSVMFGLTLSDGSIGGGLSSNAAALSMNKWYHLAGTFGNRVGTLYLNGRQLASQTYSQGVKMISWGVLIGFQNSPYIFPGIIDEIRISNIARTPQQFNLHLAPQNLTASTSGTTVNLSWQDAGGGIGLFKYRIYRGSDSINVSLIDSTTQTTYENTGVTEGTIYVYRVGAVDSTGFENMSYARASGIPAPPALLAPANASTGVLIPFNLTWNASIGAQSYRIQISSTQDFSTILYDQANLTSTSLLITPAGNTAYYWRVSAVNSAGASGWSTIYSFTTQNILPPPVSRTWQFIKTFFNSTTGSLGIQGLAVDPEGKVWVSPYGASDSILVGSVYLKTRVLYVFYPNGTQAPFSPIKMITVGGVTDTLYNSSRGLTTDHQGNILYSSSIVLYRIDYKTGQGLNKVTPQSNVTLTAAAADISGNIFIGKVTPGYSIQVFNSGFTALGNVETATTGYSRSIGVTRDGKDVFWPEYQYTKALIRYHSDNGAVGPYTKMENLFDGLAIESMTRHPITGYLWVSSGSDMNPPVPPYTKQTWYAFDPITKQIVDTLGWNMISGTEQYRPRGIAFSPTGDTCYIGCSSFDGPVVQMFIRSTLPPPASWNFAQSTGKNATIAVPFAINPKIATSPLKTGDAIGVFFQRDNDLVCAGYSIWQEGQNAAIAVWGDNDQTTTLKDGFNEGELIQFKIWDGQAGKEYPATVTYQSGPGVNYQTNGIYALSSLVGITS
ncbi:MAG: LamG-like jellyroll fold domain-containing protein, partial [bacterium]